MKTATPLRTVWTWLAAVAIGVAAAGAVPAAEPVRVIFDTDMANDCDDAGALAVLNALADAGEAEILAVVTNRKDSAFASAAAADAINTWYGRPDVPIGTDKDGATIRGGRPSSYTPALRDEFPHDARSDLEMPDALTVYRRTLAAQPDRSVVICSVGALSNLEDLLRSGPDEHSPLTGRELIGKKVRETVIMGGGFPRTAVPETNIKLDPAAAVTVVNDWPGPILWQGFEVGAKIITGTGLQATPETNPVRRAFELRPFHDGTALQLGKPSHDQAAVLLAVRGPQPEYWIVVERGRVVCDSDGHTRWNTDWNKRHRYVRIRGHQRHLERVIEELMARPPRHLSQREGNPS
ncbi:nucleoside hydrolase [Maioricimonas sp. JC845]|uniref:nucleoside hydrolase n=1 Tax=Maioricimonas sp. JC845 TaxID=3232138 RepID=UPI003457926A